MLGAGFGLVPPGYGVIVAADADIAPVANRSAERTTAGGEGHLVHTENAARLS
jgi:hypothetical protein